MRLLNKYFLFLILIVSIFFNFYHLEKLTPFGWDQARDAQIMWQILIDHKLTLIGPGVVGPDSFFLGPLWYYSLLPFYFVTSLNPIAASIFGGLVGIFTTAVIFLLIKKFLGTNVAVINGVIWSTFFSRRVWNPILIPICSILFIYFLIKTSDGENKFIPIIFLLFGLSLQIHFQSIAFIVPIAISLYFYLKKVNKIPLKKIAIGLVLFILTFIPLIVFDLRHNFLNTSAFIKFFSFSQVSNMSININSSLIKFFSFTASLFPEIQMKNGLLGVLLSLLSIISITTSKLNRKIKVIIISLILTPIILFSFYSGSLSEYYFVITWIPIIIGVSLILERVFKIFKFGKYAVILILFVFVAERFVGLLKQVNLEGLYYQKQTVNYIVQQKLDPVFNVSYSVPVGDDMGFKYLFKFYGKEPQNTSEGHLWTISIPPNAENIIPTASFGNIGVVRR